MLLCYYVVIYITVKKMWLTNSIIETKQNGRTFLEHFIAFCFSFEFLYRCFFFFQTQMMFDFEDTERWFLRYFAAETVFVFNSWNGVRKTALPTAWQPLHALVCFQRCFIKEKLKFVTSKLSFIWPWTWSKSMVF